MTRSTTHVAWIATALCGIALLNFSGCSSKSTADEGAPQGSTINLSASPTTIQSGNSSVVEATVLSNGSGVSGATVTFSVSPSSAGSFSPSSVVTDANGFGAVAFTGTTEGTCTITATVSGTSVTRTVNMAITAGGGGGASGGNITVNSSPSLLLANGSDSSTVTIAVRDALGQAVPDSTEIKLVAGEKFLDRDSNGYWSPGIDSLLADANANGQWDAIGLIPSTAFTTGGTGNASVNYVSGTTAYTVYIKVTVDDNGVEDAVEIPLQLSPNSTMNAIFLSADTMVMSVKATGGIETSILRATGFDINGNRVPAGLTINFVILDGPSGGERLGNTGYGPYAGVTNSQGVATCPIHSDTVSGTIRVRAYADTVLSNATQVLVAAGPPAHIVVGAEECNVDFWDNVGTNNGGYNNIAGVVSDRYLNPVNDSTVVYFSTDEGTMKATEERTSNREGLVSSRWYSGNNVPTADGIVEIRAETSGGTVADTSFFYNTHYASVITATGVPATILADGTSRYFVWVSAVDLNGNPVIGGTPFNGEANYLSVTGGTFEDGCAGASDRVSITSKTLDIDNSVTGGNDNGIGANDVVTFWTASGAFASYPVTVLTGTAHRGSSSINGPTSAGVGDLLNFSVTIVDRWGNPLGDHTLVMTATGGTVSGGTQETDSYGEAAGFTWTAPAGLGDYTLTVTDTDPRGGIVLTAKVTVE